MAEKFSIPTVEKEKIGPKKGPSKLSEEERERRKERREREDSLAPYILKWWRGDAHTHSKESTREGYGYPEGIYDIEEVMDYYEALGLEFVCFAEHSSKPGSPRRQSTDGEISQSLLREAQRITAINQERKEGTIALSGVEVNIFFDDDGKPTLDLSPEVLQKLDLVIASRHAIAREKDPEAIKETLLFATRNPNVDVIGHPDRYTRKDGETSPEYWKEYWDVWTEILEEMVKHRKAFEINLNSLPSRRLVEMAAGAGVKFFIDYDAHDFSQYKKERTKLHEVEEEAKRRWARGEVSGEDSEILKEYKLGRLSSGPGVVAILRLVRQIRRLEALGVTPERVVNSSRENLLKFLIEDREKKTENLAYLTASEESVWPSTKQALRLI